MKAQDDLTRAAARVAAGARRDRRAPQGAPLRRLRSARRSTAARATSSRGGTRTEEKAIVYWKEGRGRRREGPPRPERLVRGRQRRARRVERLVGRQARRLREEGQQLRRGDALRHGRRDREGLRRGRHRGRQVRVGLVDARRHGFYYTWLPVDPKIPAAERPGCAEVRFHRLGTDPKTDAVVKDEARRPDDVPERRPLARRPLPVPHRSRTAGRRTDVYFRDLETNAGRHGLDAAGRRDQGALQRRDVRPRRSTSRRTTARRRAAIFAVDPAKPGARGVEGDRPRAPGRDAPELRRRRREARARLPQERLEPPRDPQPRRHAPARGRRSPASGPRATSRAATTRTRRTSRSRRSRRRRPSTGRP